ncbi:substrate-binding and VWA domain-containing protein [Nocardioides panacisoli]|uniref:VWA domain-containing protein n=1 Tax=Nocardioides panacisoli TaxID=627624 RepID=UPI001C634D24|nr:VWA domain-containing protein [Nocardioides panacisoli]QYJ04334.1 substrate-binding and VWA domain-containing protein [Nocardioides panacisoli]
MSLVTEGASGHGHRASHRAQRSLPWRWVAVGAALLVALLVVAALTVIGEDAPVPVGATECDREVDLAADPGIAEALTAVLDDAGCDGVTVTAAPTQRVLARLRTGVGVPDLWVPDSSLWVPGAGEAATVALESVATTPVVLVAGRGDPPGTWQRAVKSPRFTAADPLASTASVVALYAGAADSEEALATLAQGAASPEGDEDPVAAVAGSRSLTAVSEQQWLAAAPDLTAAVPRRGTVLLDHPLVVTAGEERRDEATDAADALTEVLTADAATRTLSGMGFRGADGAPTDAGVGEVATIPMDGDAAGDLLQRWSTLAIPTRTLAVFDVSGSMDFAAGDTTRIELTAEAARRGLALFPRTAEVGLWAFSQADDGELDGDRRELLPTRSLDARTDGGTHREALGAAIEELPGLVGGGTSLYDTAVAAYEEAVAGYQSDVVNSVLLFTDGANDDADSLTREEALTALRDAVDPDRPVRIIGIGISEDADEAALRDIAAATGGQSYVARSPADIASVFQRAISARE